MGDTEREQVRQRLTDALHDNGCHIDDAAELADALLSLPGIAIVELPEPDEETHHGLIFNPWPYQVLAVTKGVDAGFVDVDHRHLLYKNARTLAAALLAAADAAERAC